MKTKESINELALFAGIGGGLIGTHHLLGWKCVCAVERIPYRQESLLRRQQDGLLPLFPIWDDVRTFDGNPWRGIVDVVTAGFPCQPFTTSGLQKGESDERNMWPETIRIIREVGPAFALLENVPGLLSFDYFGTILGDLAEAGYDAKWTTLSVAPFKDAPQIRERLWILAYHSEIGTYSFGNEKGNTFGLFQTWQTKNFCDVHCIDGTIRKIPSEFLRMDDGLPNWVDRVAACGDAQVPQVAATAFIILLNTICV